MAYTRACVEEELVVEQRIPTEPSEDEDMAINQHRTAPKLSLLLISPHLPVCACVAAFSRKRPWPLGTEVPAGRGGQSHSLTLFAWLAPANLARDATAIGTTEYAEGPAIALWQPAADYKGMVGISGGAVGGEWGRYLWQFRATGKTPLAIIRSHGDSIAPSGPRKVGGGEGTRASGCFAHML